MTVNRSDLEVLFSAEQIRQRVAELGAAITRDFEGKDLAVVGILKGSFLFMADLVRAIDVDLTCDFLGLSSYGMRTKSSGVVKITSDLTLPIEGRDVLVVEDIIDTGLTMRYLLDNLRTRKPASIKTATLLLRKQGRREDCQVEIDYVGFPIDDHYVIGYGLDYAGLHRNVPFVGYKAD